VRSVTCVPISHWRNSNNVTKDYACMMAKKTRVWVGIKLQENYQNYLNHVSLPSLERSESVISSKEIRETGNSGNLKKKKFKEKL